MNVETVTENFEKIINEKKIIVFIAMNHQCKLLLK